MATDNQTIAIQNIQRYLRQLSYHDPAIPSVPIDGIYEADTRRAVEAFQRLQGLPVTGIVDRVTFDALYVAYIDSLLEHAAPEAPDLFPRNPAAYEITVGDALFTVYAIQHMLGEIGIIHDELEEQPLTGTYSEGNAEAVRRFQENVGLPVTGRVDRATWNTLVREYNRYAEGRYQ